MNYVKTTMTYSANAGYTITKVEVAVYRVLGMNEVYLGGGMQVTGPFNGTYGSVQIVINFPGTYRVKIRMYTVMGGMMQPPVEAVSPDQNVP